MLQVYWSNLEGEDILHCSSGTESTVDSEDENDVVAALREASGHVWKATSCSLFEVDGDFVEGLVSKATVSFKGSGFTVQGIPTERCLREHSNSSGKFSFLGDNISHFRQLRPRIVQWMDTKAAGLLNEHGLVFEDDKSAHRFCRLVREFRKKSMRVLRQMPGTMSQYDSHTKTWTAIKTEVSFKILQRPSDYLSYVHVTNQLGTVVAEVEISHDECIFLDPSRSTVTWWGTDVNSIDGLYGWFRVVLEVSRGELHYTFTCIETCLREHCAGRKVETDACLLYDDEAFDRKWSRDADAVDVWAEVVRHTTVNEEPRFAQRSAGASNGKQSTFPTHSAMAVGSELSYVVRSWKSCTSATGSELSVVRFDDAGNEETINDHDKRSLVYEGQGLSPRGLELHNCERQMLLLDKDDDLHVYLMDIEHQKVVQKMNAGGWRIQRMFSAFRGSFASSEPSFMCHSATSFCSMDPRCPSESCLIGNNYRTVCRSHCANVQLTCGATDGEGHIVLGSKLGYYRLYNNRAVDSIGRYDKETNLFKGLGDPLVYVDVNKSGSWLLGTHSKFLALTPTMLAAGRGSAFVNNIGRTRGRPITLRLSNEDMIDNGLTELCFTKAVFDEEGTSIIASTGNLVIVWDVATVLQSNDGGGQAHKIYVMEDFVEDVGFISNNRTLIASSALPGKVVSTVVKTWS
eukprot:GHVS01065336.1.p1 GENE.GHVS01065336.1~~GHVS01065336.1.p1  ORF type:complete len:687 (+),score=53.54 GHVS01065336.1:178-2238(+)